MREYSRKLHDADCAIFTLADQATHRWWPECDCKTGKTVDPAAIKEYSSNHRIGDRSKTMDEDLDMKMCCDNCGSEDHWEEDCYEYEEEVTVRGFLSRLETFLDTQLDDISRGNVFLSENDGGASLNILIGAPFADSGDETLKQINVIIAPTDRALLGAEGLTIHDMERVVEDETGDEDYSSPFDEAMQILD